MTLRETIKRIHPEACKPNACGGVEGCPFMYGLAPIECPEGTYADLNAKCTACWDREAVDLWTDTTEVQK